MWRRLACMTALASVVECRGKPPEPLLVAAAADLAHAFVEITPAFSAQTPSELKLTVGSSGLLARQIEQGAPFDLFLAANTGYVEQVVKAGACDGATQFTYARGRIVIWTKGNGGAAPTSLVALRDPRYKHIAIANPEHAPYGIAAREALTRVGVWSEVSERLVYGENVQQTLELAQTGNADVAIVGLSLALGASGGSWTPIDESSYTPIDQALVVCKHGTNPGSARKLAEFLKSSAGREILRKCGFTLPNNAATKSP